MNREQIIRMAREASNNASGLYEENSDLVMLYLDELERFAALVATAEREACAKVCEPLAGFVYSQNTLDTMKNCAAAIRARGQE